MSGSPFSGNLGLSYTRGASLYFRHSPPKYVDSYVTRCGDRPLLKCKMFFWVSVCHVFGVEAWGVYFYVWDFWTDSRVLTLNTFSLFRQRCMHQLLLRWLRLGARLSSCKMLRHHPKSAYCHSKGSSDRHAPSSHQGTFEHIDFPRIFFSDLI